jgi:hypothetical protein
MGSRWVSGAAASIALVTSGSALAAEPPAPNAEAQAIFAEARKLDEAGDLPNACALYREALTLEPNAVGGRLHLARCLERTDKLASAANEYAAAERAATSTNQPERALHARRQQQALASRLGTVVIEVPRVAREVAEDLVVRLDGDALDATRWGQPIWADAGRHVLDASATGRTSFQSSFVVKLGERTRVDVPVLPRRAASRVWPWVVGGLGLAMGATAGVFAFDQAVTQARIHERCDATSCDTSGGFDPASANARLDRDFGLALGLGIGGGLALGAGILGLVVPSNSDAAPATGSAPRVTPWIGPRVAGVAVEMRIE